MSTFAERFNAWLVEHGKEPLSEELQALIDEAARETAADLRAHKAEIVEGIRQLGADLAAGRPVDPEATAKELHRRLREADKEG